MTTDNALQHQAALNSFLAEWTTDENGIKPLFLELYACLQDMSDVQLEYKGRPGVSHSLRALYPGKKERPLFVLVDIIDDEPGARWLSMCFYADLVTDPDGLGDVVPEGLFGEDACCFDVESPENGTFFLARLREAYKNVSRAA